MKIATYDNLNNYTAKYNDYVDYSSKIQQETQKTTNHIAKRKKAKNKLNFSDFMAGMFFSNILILLIVGYGSWIAELIYG
jgi:hypothetical protein